MRPAPASCSAGARRCPAVVPSRSAAACRSAADFRPAGERRSAAAACRCRAEAFPQAVASPRAAASPRVAASPPAGFRAAACRPSAAASPRVAAASRRVAGFRCPAEGLPRPAGWTHLVAATGSANPRRYRARPVPASTPRPPPMRVPGADETVVLVSYPGTPFACTTSRLCPAAPADCPPSLPFPEATEARDPPARGGTMSQPPRMVNTESAFHPGGIWNDCAGCNGVKPANWVSVVDRTPTADLRLHSGADSCSGCAAPIPKWLQEPGLPEVDQTTVLWRGTDSPRRRALGRRAQTHRKGRRP
jgi:hypothetical protein